MVITSFLESMEFAFNEILLILFPNELYKSPCKALSKIDKDNIINVAIMVALFEGKSAGVIIAFTPSLKMP